jgi:hypothetical protein
MSKIVHYNASKRVTIIQLAENTAGPMGRVSKEKFRAKKKLWYDLSSPLPAHT